MLAGEPSLEDKKKTLRADFYGKHDAAVAEISRQRDDPWERRKFINKRDVCAGNQEIQRRQSTLSGVQDQYMRLVEARRMEGAVNSETEESRGAMSGEKESRRAVSGEAELRGNAMSGEAQESRGEATLLQERSAAEISIDRWLNSIDLKETDCDGPSRTNSGSNGTEQMIQSDSEEEIII